MSFAVYLYCAARLLHLPRREREGRDALDRRVIQREYEAYIWSEAGENQISLSSVHVETYWSTEGVWVPSAVTLEGIWTEGQRDMLETVIERDLGIPRERQAWEKDDSSE